MKESGVPVYEKFVLSEKSSDIACCVFVINEGEKIKKQVERMSCFSDQVDIIICDGGSTDGSLQEEHLLKNKVKKLLVKKDAGKLGTQMRMGFWECVQENYTGVICVDGNGKDDISAIPTFASLLRNGWDHIQGSRYIEGGKHENTPLSRELASKIIHVPMIRFASGFKYTDTTNGFRGYSTKFLSSPQLSAFRSIFQGYEYHYYLAVKAPKLGFKTCETPVTRVYPKSGKIPTKISPIKGNALVLKNLFDVCLTNKYNA